MSRTGDDQLLLGEWACLGMLYAGAEPRVRDRGPTAPRWGCRSRLVADQAADLPVARATHRSGLRRTHRRGARGRRPQPDGADSDALGRSRFRGWTRTPVSHLRDLRSELLLKLVLADQCGLDVHAMLIEQRHIVQDLADALAGRAEPGDDVDVVHAWRHETSEAALRFLDGITPTR